MATDIAGLFTTPEQYQLAQDQAQQAQAIQFAQLDPRAQAQYGFYRGGQQLGSAIGGALGGQDPQLKLISQRQQLASQLDQSNPESFMKIAQLAAQSGDPQFAMAIADAGRQLQASIATTRKSTVEIERAELSLKQEKELRDELSKLPANATDADVLNVVTKYGSADKVLSALQASSDKAAQRELLSAQQTERLAQQERLARERLEAQAEQARKDNEARLERARENNATKAELATISAEGKAQQNAITNSIREQTLQIRQEAANEKKVAAQRQQQGMVSSFDTALDTLDVIANHPGKKAGVGFGGAQLSMIPGTDAAGFAAQLETFKAQTFLPQVQALKGMGALSDAEGKKLTAAVGALSQSMKLEEFNSQIAKIKRDLQAARDRVSAGTNAPNAPTQPAQPSTGKTIKFSDLP
jgi:hypothetical protein